MMRFQAVHSPEERIMATQPDPRTAPDDDATNQGVSAPDPAEGADNAPDGDKGSPDE